jgi:hypothetical protein
MPAKKLYEADAVSSQGTAITPNFVVNIRGTGFQSDIILTLSGPEKELTKLAANAVLTFLNKSGG